MLALLDAACEEDRQPVISHGVCFRRFPFELAGHGFHYAYERPVLEARRKKKPAASAAKDASDDEPEAAADASWRKKRKEGGAKSSILKLSPQLQGQDLYRLLEVSESASAEQIKKQYRKMALQHHPDKQDAEGPSDKPSSGLSEKDLLFIRIQEAYEVLSDQSKRRQYDSQLDFDESVPDEVDESIGFFKTFGPVFARNARWSNRHPVPELGDESTDIHKVHKFYDFWLSFETWRDFSMHGEYNLEEAEFREERRWMERQNQKIVKGYDLEERRRILRLAETAERFDPRIRAEREEKEARKREEKERRARVKQEEEDAKRQAVEEKRRKEEEEKARKEEEERLARERRKEAQQVAKGLRQRLKKWASANCKLSTEESDDLQQLCLASESEALEALCGRLEKVAKDADAAIRREMREFKQRRTEEEEQEKRAKEEARKKEEKKQTAARDAAAAAAAGAPWSTEELGVLAKGLQKYPGGQAGRWNLIAQMLSATGHIRTDQEVIAKTKELSEGQSLRSMGATISANSTGAFQAAAKPKAKAAAKAAAEPAAPAAAAPAAAKASAEAAPAGDAAEWSPDQQKALEEALKKHPASMDKNERWKAIAEDVPGKTKAQCVERFKFLREQLSKQKKG